MAPIKYVVDRAAVIVTAAWTAVSPLLVEQSIISAHLALDLGVGLTAALGAYHGGVTVQAKTSTPAEPDAAK